MACDPAGGCAHTWPPNYFSLDKQSRDAPSASGTAHGFLAPCPRGGLEQRNWKTTNCPAYLPAAVGAHCSSMVPTRSACASRSHPCPQHSPPTPPPQSAQPHTCSPRRALSPFPAKAPCCWGDVQTTVRRLELGSKSQHLLRLYNPPGGGAFGRGLAGAWSGQG